VRFIHSIAGGSFFIFFHFNYSRRVPDARYRKQVFHNFGKRFARTNGVVDRPLAAASARPLHRVAKLKNNEVGVERRRIGLSFLYEYEPIRIAETPHREANAAHVGGTRLVGLGHRCHARIRRGHPDADAFCLAIVVGAAGET
jgi:hypothetical protein